MELLLELSVSAKLASEFLGFFMELGPVLLEDFVRVCSFGEVRRFSRGFTEMAGIGSNPCLVFVGSVAAQLLLAESLVLPRFPQGWGDVCGRGCELGFYLAAVFLIVFCAPDPHRRPRDMALVVGASGPALALL